MTSFLIITNCRLGDSIILAPSLRLLKQRYPDASITLASETPAHGYVTARDILDDRGLVDDFVQLAFPPSFLGRLKERLKFFVAMRKRRFTHGIVLFPPYSPLTMRLVKRLKLYLRLCGIRRITAPAEILSERRDSHTHALLPQMHVIDATLRVLAPLGITVPPPGEADAALPPRRHETALSITLPAHTHLLAVAPGSNYPCKNWPVERFAEALAHLQPLYTPVYFGGETDRPLCEQLNARVSGILVIGQPLSQVEAVMRHCHAYLGNDTGLMHLAAALGIPCTAIFSARQAPGLWYPYGNHHHHVILRASNLPCEGCEAENCPVPGHPCLHGISPQEVVDACLSQKQS